MSRRLAKATKLVTFRQEELEEEESEYVVEAEPWQVGVYTPGGHFIAHNDDFDHPDKVAVTSDGEIHCPRPQY